MKKNTQLHLVVETDLFERLKRQAQEEGTTISELCRKKLRECSRLTKIELMLEDLIKNRKIYKQVPLKNSNTE